MDAAALPPSPFWQPKLGSLGETVVGLAELEQAVCLIIQTPAGSVPLEPEFGCALLDWLDKPEPLAAPAIIRAIAKAIKRWESRVIVESIAIVRAAPGKQSAVVRWRPSEAWHAAAVQKTEVGLWAA